MSGRAFRTLTVVQKQYLTPHMIRIVLGGQALKSFPADHEGGYIKLCFPLGDNIPVEADLAATDFIKRSYTVRAFDQVTQTLTLDFVVHGDGGPASTWATTARVGDNIITDGPAAVRRVNPTADWFMITGDMSALPAIHVNVETLPQHARGYAVIEVPSITDQQVVNAPTGLTIQWVINPGLGEADSRLVDAVTALPWLDGTPDVWLAGEFETMRYLRRYFKQQRGVTRGQLYASSYWKRGETDEGNKLAKKNDVEAE